MQKLMKALHKNEKGFTLVELMVVVVIIGILVAIAIPIYGMITARAERSTITANVRILDGAIMMATADDVAPNQVDPADTGAVINELGNYIEPIEQVGGEEYGIGNFNDSDSIRAFVTTSNNDPVEGRFNPETTYTLQGLLEFDPN